MTAFLRIINTPKRGMGPATLERRVYFAQEHSISLLALYHAGLLTFCRLKAYGTIKEFGEFIEHYTRELDQHPDPLPIVRQMIDETGYIDFVRSDSKTRNKKTVLIISICSTPVFSRWLIVPKKTENDDWYHHS